MTDIRPELLPLDHVCEHLFEALCSSLGDDIDWYGNGFYVTESILKHEREVLERRTPAGQDSLREGRRDPMPDVWIRNVPDVGASTETPVYNRCSGASGCGLALPEMSRTFGVRTEGRDVLEGDGAI